MKMLFILIPLFSLSLAHAKKPIAKPKKAAAVKSEAAKNPAKEVDGVLASYRAAKAIKAKVKKTVVQEVMGTSMKSEGSFFFSKGKLRLEMREPERTTLVYDGKHVWFES